VFEEEKRLITDKEFYKAMQKLKERGSSAVPPKKAASAYIIFGKEVGSKHFLKSINNPLFLNRKELRFWKETLLLKWQKWLRKSLNAGVWWIKKIGKSTKKPLKEVSFLYVLIIWYLDKERYEKELRSLESFSEKLKKPKKCLSAYMIFVKEVKYILLNLLDPTINRWCSSRDGSLVSYAGSREKLVSDGKWRKKIFQR
jgi:hypothetical protein